MRNLLNGVRIVDVTTIVMGPFASQILADLGADVVKVEAPGGDLGRYSGSPGPQGMGALFANNNRNKKSLGINLKHDAGREVMERLIGRSDVLLHNMRPDAAAKLGLAPRVVRKINPALIYCAAVGFGSAGPYAGRAAYDDIIQSVSGLAALPLAVGREPDYVPSIVADKIAALHVVYAVLAALLRRASTGEGCDIEVPMFEAIVAFMLNEHLDAATFASDGEPGYARLLNPNRRPYRTADGWMALMPYSEAHWRRTLGEMGRHDVTSETWFGSASGRNARSETLYGILAECLPARTSDVWSKVFSKLDVPHAQLGTLEGLLTDPHLDAVGFFQPSDNLSGRVRSVPQPVVFADMGENLDRPPPELGEDTDSVLGELGYSRAEIDELMTKEAVFGSNKPPGTT